MENRMDTTSDNPGVIVIPPLLYGLSFVLVLVLRWLWPMPILGGAIAVWLGVALVLFGATVLISGRRAMDSAGTNVNPTLPTTAIVTSGPFRFSRNPLYVGLTIVFSG